MGGAKRYPSPRKWVDCVIDVSDESMMGIASLHPSYSPSYNTNKFNHDERYVHQIRPLDSPHGGITQNDRALCARSGALRRWTQNRVVRDVELRLRYSLRQRIFTNINSTIVDPKAFDEKSFVDFKGDVCIIPPNSFALARTVEYFRIPRSVLTICVGKSTYARCGIIVNVTPFEPEWEGYVTLEFSNTTPLPAKIYAGEGCAQVLFFESDEICGTSYKDRGGKYQGQVGVTLPKT
jgi:dCTP deaminase